MKAFLQFMLYTMIVALIAAIIQPSVERLCGFGRRAVKDLLSSYKEQWEEYKRKKGGDSN